MKPVLFLSVFILACSMAVHSQESTKSNQSEVRRIKNRKQVEKIVNAKEFIFVARIAIPSGMQSVNLPSGQNYVKFEPELIDSNLPFFGTANFGVGYGTDPALHFKGKPDVFTIIKQEKNYLVNVVFKGESDIFKLSITIGFEGNASLTITSNKRSTISYQGEISPI
jgi:hypothetical protein